MSRSAGASAAVVLVATVAALAADPPPRGIQRPLDPPSNPSTPEKVALGAKLFADKRLSKDGTVACATCHVASLAFTDGRATSIGIGKQVIHRNAPTLLNVSLNKTYFWDGRSASLEDQARHPVLNPQEMGQALAEDCAKSVEGCPEYPPMFKAAFGDTTITLQRIARAIAAFERTLLAGDAPFDRWWAGDAGAMDEPAKRGFLLFKDKAGCAQCHSIRQSYALFTDHDFHNTGAGKEGDPKFGKADPGRFEVTKKEEDRGAFRTPTLRNVALTGPFMHDGSLATLEEVVEFYAKGGAPNPHLSPLIRPIELTAEDKTDLVAFLKALTSTALPQLEECDKLLADGRPREAFDAFSAELQRDPNSAKALTGVARSAVVLNDAKSLEFADAALRKRIGVLSPDRSKDGEEPLPALLFWLGRVDQVLSRHDDGTAVARQEDAIAALRRARDGGKASVECLVLEARMLEEVRGSEEALAALDAAIAARPGETLLFETRGDVQYRTVWQADGPLNDASRARLLRAIDDYQRVPKLSDGSALSRAYSHHRLGDVEHGRAAYAEAACREAISTNALTGLRNLLAKDLVTFRSDLEAVRKRCPDSPSVLLFAAYEELQQDRLDDAERDLRRRRDVEGQASAATHYYLAQIAIKRGDRRAATDNFAIALALEPNYRARATPPFKIEYESYLRSRPLNGFGDVDALVADYRQFFEAGPDEPGFQVLARNNLGFTLREVAASYTSRGPARIHTFPEGAPQKAKDVLKLCVQIYEEAVALIPEDAAEGSFKDRWDYAAVLNDTGLMRHYFADTQDLERAESLYLRAFELTRGSYQDSYFYNLQFLYGFELTGRDEQWWALAKVAKDAILKEDPKAPGGFSPDEFKRTAARRDFERLTAKLGK